MRLLPSGRRAVIRSAHFTLLEKSPAIIKLIEDSISSAQKERFNELLGEIEDHYGLKDSIIEQASPPSPLPTPDLPPEQPVVIEEHKHDVPEDPINFFGTPDPTEQPPEPTVTVHEPQGVQDTGTSAD